MENIIQIYFYFILWSKTHSKKEGNFNIFEKKFKRNLSLIIPINKKKYLHIHHWLWLSFIAKKYKKNKHILSLCLGGILQGLFYKDSLKIIKNNMKSRVFLKKINNL